MSFTLTVAVMSPIRVTAGAGIVASRVFSSLVLSNVGRDLRGKDLRVSVVVVMIVSE
jgi:hypothetical protein